MMRHGWYVSVSLTVDLGSPELTKLTCSVARLPSKACSFLNTSFSSHQNKIMILLKLHTKADQIIPPPFSLRLPKVCLSVFPLLLILLWHALLV